MYSGTIPRNQEGRASRAPAKTINHPQAYELRRPMSSVKLLPTPDRRPAQAPAPQPSASSDAVALGLLLLLLSANANGLTSREARKGWGLAERWAGQYVEMKHAIRGAA
jgi:hypothetical protein